MLTNNSFPPLNAVQSFRYATNKRTSSTLRTWYNNSGCAKRLPPAALIIHPFYFQPASILWKKTQMMEHILFKYPRLLTLDSDKQYLSGMDFVKSLSRENILFDVQVRDQTERILLVFIHFSLTSIFCVIWKQGAKILAFWIWEVSLSKSRLSTKVKSDTCPEH